MMAIRREELIQLPSWAQRSIAAQLGEAQAVDKPKSKYKNQRVTVDGLRFDSKREAKRYSLLMAMKEAKTVLGFCRQPRFPLPGGVEYVADFIIWWSDGRVTVEDVKGVRTKTYRLKKRQVEAIHHVEITET
jgi:hypothetical protein